MASSIPASPAVVPPERDSYEASAQMSVTVLDERYKRKEESGKTLVFAGNGSVPRFRGKATQKSLASEKVMPTVDAVSQQLCLNELRGYL